MDTSKIIIGTVGGGRYTVTSPIVKEDYGLYLLIEGLELPSTYEVDFSNSEHSGTSVTMIGNSDGVLIPSQFIKSGKDVFAFLYHVGADFGRTVYKFRIPNKLRPDRTNEEPTPEEQSVIDQAINALNEAVESAQDAQEAIENMSVSATTLAEGSSATVTKTESEGVVHLAFGIPTGATGAKGDKGDKGDTGESGEDALSVEITNPRMTIPVGSDGYTTKQVYIKPIISAYKGSTKVDYTLVTAGDVTVLTREGVMWGIPAEVETGKNNPPEWTIPVDRRFWSNTGELSITVTVEGQTVKLAYGYTVLADGAKGEKGDKGDSPTITASKTGKTTSIYVDGSEIAQIKDGTDGIDGDDGYSPSVTVTDITGGHRVVITDESGSKTFDVMDGATGATPNLTIGTVETLEPAESATASITGTPENPVLNLGIPQGEQGEVTLEEFYKAFPTDTASGAIASFSDGADDLPLKSLVVDINPIQDLSHGDPSPENICPISGHTQAVVTRTGVNVWDEEWEVGGYNINTGKKTVNNLFIRCKNPISVVSGQMYHVICPTNMFAIGKDKDGNCMGLLKSTTNVTSLSNKDILIPSSVVAVCWYSDNYGTTYNHDISINYPSTDHSYHPYAGRSITINLGQTVYGGKLDVLSGVMTVDRAMVDLGTLYWYVTSNPAGMTAHNTDISVLPSALYSNPNAETDILCEKYKTCKYNDITIGREIGVAMFGSGDARYIRIFNPEYANKTATEIKADLSGVKLIYTLLTPIEIQLSPNHINSLLGVNNIWADSGNTEVEYRADTKLFIERLTAPDSADMVADSNITSGKYFMVGNSLYKATANIANGSAIVVGTNCIRKSLSEALNEINA